MTPPCSVTRRQAWRWSMALIVALALLGAHAQGDPEPPTATGEALSSPEPMPKPIASIDVTWGIKTLVHSPDGRFLAFTAYQFRSSDVRVYTLPQLQLHQEWLMPYGDNIREVVFCRGSEWVAAAGNKYVRVWSNDTGKLKWKWGIGDGSISAWLAYSPGMRAIAVGPVYEPTVRENGMPGRPTPTIQIRGLQSGRIKRTLRAKDDSSSGVGDLVVTPNGQRVSAIGDLGLVWTWNIRTGRIVSKLRLKNRVEALAYSRDGKMLATAGGVGPTWVVIWDMKTGRHVRQLCGWQSTTDFVLQFGEVTFSPDGKLLVAGDTEGRLAIWQVKTGKLVRELHLKKKNPIYCLSFAPNGKSLAVGHKRGLSIWKTADLLGD